MVERKRHLRGIRMDMRWKQIFYLHGVMRMAKYRKPGMDDLDDLVGAFRQCVQDNINQDLVDRDQFTKVIKTTYDLVIPKQLNRLFSAFDVGREDLLNWPLFMSAMRTLRRPNEKCETKLEAYFDIFDWRKKGVVSKENILQLLSVCARDEAESMHIQKLTRFSFTAV